MHVRRFDPSEASDDWIAVSAEEPPPIRRPRDVPAPVSADEVGAWANASDMRRTELVRAPIFWVVLPVAALAFLAQQAITDPTGEAWGKQFNGEYVDEWPVWFLWCVWIGAFVWLLSAVAVLVNRRRMMREAGRDDEHVFELGAACSIHRASVDYDDGECTGWPTYIALDHRLPDRHAALVHAAFERWLAREGVPEADPGRIRSESLFGEKAAGGYFFRSLPGIQISGTTTERRWLLVAESRVGGAELLVVPVPVGARFRRIRERALRRAARRGA